MDAKQSDCPISFLHTSTNNMSFIGQLFKHRFIYCSSALGSLLFGAVVISCQGCRSHPSDRPVGTVVHITPPLGLPPVPIPADNPPTAETISLGRELFYDRRLSRDDSVACATCHEPTLAFTDHRKVSLGVGGTSGVRNAPTVINAAYLPVQFWMAGLSVSKSRRRGPSLTPWR